MLREAICSILDRCFCCSYICMVLSTALFSVVTKRVAVIYYRRFGTTYRSHPQGSRTQKNLVNPFLFFFWTLEPSGWVIPKRRQFLTDVSVQPIGPILRVQESKIILWIPFFFILDSWTLRMGCTETSAISYRRFGTTYRSHPQGLRIQTNLVDPFFLLDSWTLRMGCTETSVSNYSYSLRNNPAERRRHLLRGGSLKFSWFCWICQSTCYISALKQASTASLHILSESLIYCRTIIRCIVIQFTGSVVQLTAN